MLEENCAKGATVQVANTSVLEYNPPSVRLGAFVKQYKYTHFGHLGSNDGGLEIYF